MNILKKILTASLLFTALSGVVATAQSESINDQQIERILTNCSSTKNTLNQLHASDALLRVNRGQIYESMSTKLMNGFNARIANNRYDNENLVVVTKNYNSALDAFRLDYKTYEEHLTIAINLDCKKQPVSFFDAVILARNDRVRVHENILKLNQLVDQYQLAIDQFEKDYTNAVGGLRG